MIFGCSRRYALQEFTERRAGFHSYGRNVLDHRDSWAGYQFGFGIVLFHLRAIVPRASRSLRATMIITRVDRVMSEETNDADRQVVERDGMDFKAVIKMS